MDAATMATEAIKETAIDVMEAEAAMQGYARRPVAGAKYRKPNQTRAARQRKEMVADFVAALGGRISPIQLQDVERAVDLVMLARDMRASVRQGAAKVSDLTRLEGAADRAVRRLNLPAPSRAAPVMTLNDHVAANYATPDASEGEEE
jgi:hypothetical protein